ncbi:hypothetical protein RJ999_07960 [Aliarcobacter butzleri]|uniref:hypothetical protein n=1 Tax=Aliarcobacter butzleri TaxID=28197 RepID=UPI002876DD57|nr:hypothetical protein [Aliarcobacter butzleri]MDS1371026.1 hypothetical protein [Aliarcobacter butzleri]
MIVVPKDEIILISSNVPEIEENIEVYNKDITYTVRAIVQMEGCIFESNKDANTDTPIKDKTSLSWLYLGKTNKYKMFDEYMSTSTTYEDELVYKFAVNDIDTICFFGLVAQEVKIEIFQGNELVYEDIKSTYTRFASNWLEWTVQPSSYKRIIFFKNIPSFYGATLKVTISFPGSLASCSHLIFGKSLDFGMTLVDPKPTSSIRNMVSKEKQADGSVKISNSQVYKRVTLNVLLDTSRVDEVQNFLEEHSLTPMLFIGVENESMNSLTAYGFYKDFEQPITLDYSQYQIEIEGII